MKFFDAVMFFFVNFGYTLEITLAMVLFTHHYSRRKLFALRAVASYAALLAIYVLYQLFVPQTVGLRILEYLIILVFVGAVLFFMFKIGIWGALYCLCGTFATQHLGFRLTSAILALMGYGYDSLVAGLVNILCIALVYGSVLFFFRKQTATAPDKPFKSWFSVILSIFIAVLTAIMHMLESPFNLMASNKVLFCLFSLYGIFGCLFALFLQYHTFYNGVLVDDKKILEHIIRRQQEQYKISKENMDNINIKCHDMKQQISLFEKRIDREALDEIKSIISVYDTTYHTGNEVLDVFLSEKLLSCESAGIRMDCIIDGSSVEFMRPCDIYTIFGNAIDNAVEAVKRLSDPEKKMIGIHVSRKLNMTVIHFENCYSGQLAYDGDELPITMKAEKAWHGFGLRSIRLIVEKYGGNMTVRTDGDIFNLNISIPYIEGKSKD